MSKLLLTFYFCVDEFQIFIEKHLAAAFLREGVGGALPIFLREAGAGDRPARGTPKKK